MVFPRREWSQPNVQIVVRKVLAVYQLLDCPWVCAVAWQDIDIGREGENLVLQDLDRLTLLIENFNSCQSKVVHVAPRLEDIDLKLLALGQRWDGRLSHRVGRGNAVMVISLHYA